MVRPLVRSMDAEELNEWIHFGEMLLLRRQRLIQEHEDEFAWFMLILTGLLVLRFVLEALGAWPWE